MAWLAGDDVGPALPPVEREGAGWHTWTTGRLVVRWLPRRGGAAPSANAMPSLILGDGSEWQADQPDVCLAAGVPIRFDAAAQALIALTSIVGLPPLFLYRRGRTVALASDLHLLRNVPGVELSLDARALLELARIGHPVEHRTLFGGVELVASGSRLRLGADGVVHVESAWSLPTAAPLSWPDFIEAQIAAFSDGVARVRLEDAFLSLTAGLDTRTVFAMLASQGRVPPTATMTGPRWSLDARTARRLSEAYGVRHHAVVFDDRFASALPSFIERASLLSGGLSTMEQAPEVYFYDSLGGAFATRLSGNLGNQVGRGGTEGVSVRGADPGILAGDVRARGEAESGEGRHWLLDRLEQGPREQTEFILKCEIPFTLVSNFPVGSHFAVQQTPYANRALIETLARRPVSGATAPSGSRLRMRLRDLGHRFLGEPERVSFQRTLVRRLDGFAARQPINWGWRAAGGVSPAGTLMGTATLFGMYARARGLDGGVLKKPLAWTGLPALHDFREARTWLVRHLREYTRDTLASADVLESGLFERAALARALDDHFEHGADRYETVTYALDVALAYRHFQASSGVRALSPSIAG